MNIKRIGCITRILGGFGKDIVVGDRIILGGNQSAIEINTIPGISGSRFLTAVKIENPHNYKLYDKVTYDDIGDKTSNLTVIGKLNFIQRWILKWNMKPL